MTFGAERAPIRMSPPSRCFHTCVTLRRTTEAIGAFRESYETGASPAAWVLTLARPREVQPQGGLMFKPTPFAENRNRYGGLDVIH